ncbi:hypothetical protein V8D89_002954, partial [Ganoderma adspersum]
EYSDRFTSINCSNALLTILFYDWLLCLDQEVTCIWKARGGLNAGSLVYALSRFPMMLSGVLSTATAFPLSISKLTSRAPHSCRLAIWAGCAFNALSLFSVSMFSAFRVYAISGRKVAPTLGIFLLSIVQIITSLILDGRFTTVEIFPSPFNCSSVITSSSKWNFSVLALSNLVHIILTALSIYQLGGGSSIVAVFIELISSILTCHFVLNLHQVLRVYNESEPPPLFSSLFAT